MLSETSPPIVVLSFDVGIKNMAYCALSNEVMTTTPTISVPAVLDWGILNTSQSNKMSFVRTFVCTKCKRKALYVLPMEQTKGYCKTHAKMESLFVLPEKRFQRNQLVKMDKPSLLNLHQEFHIEQPTTTSVVRKCALVANLVDYFEKNCFVSVSSLFPKPQSCKQIDLITIARNLTQLLNTFTYFDKLTHVIIENQISPIANRMKTIQGFLTEYFVVKYPHVQIEYISSSNKLKVGVVATSSIAGKPTYKQNKANAVLYTTNLLDTVSSYSQWKNVFQGKKRDDLADSFLQGIYWLGIPENRVL